MNRFLSFIQKEFHHILRDRRSLLILFGMPIIQILLFGFAITNEIKNAHIAILDNSHDEITRKLIDKIASSGFFRVEMIDSDRDIERSFQKGKIKAVLEFKANFSQELTKNGLAGVQIISDATDPNTAKTINNYLLAILQGFLKEFNKGTPLPEQIDIRTRMLYNPELKGVFMFVPGIMTIILMLISALMTSISIAREKEMGTMEVLLVSPLNPLQVILGKVIPYVLLSVINAVVIILLSLYVFKMPVQGSLLLLGLESILFIITSLSLGILISNISDTQQSAMMISLMGLNLPAILLSGFIFPISSMPIYLRIISNILPAKWFVIIIKSIMLKGVNLHYIWLETSILVAMTLFFIVLSIKKYKIRLE